MTKDAVQTTFWAMLDYADRDHMERAFYQRREQIVGDCVQLKTDVDVYNDKNSDEPPIQLMLDFTDDVAERLEPIDEEAVRAFENVAGDYDDRLHALKRPQAQGTLSVTPRRGWVLWASHLWPR